MTGHIPVGDGVSTQWLMELQWWIQTGALDGGAVLTAASARRSIRSTIMPCVSQPVTAFSPAPASECECLWRRNGRAGRGIPRPREATDIGDRRSHHVHRLAVDLDDDIVDRPGRPIEVQLRAPQCQGKRRRRRDEAQPHTARGDRPQDLPAPRKAIPIERMMQYKVLRGPSRRCSGVRGRDRAARCDRHGHELVSGFGGACQQKIRGPSADLGLG